MYRDLHVKDKTVSRQSFNIRTPYLERQSLYWDRAHPAIHLLLIANTNFKALIHAVFQ